MQLDEKSINAVDRQWKHALITLLRHTDLYVYSMIQTMNVTVVNINNTSFIQFCYVQCMRII